MKPSVLATSAQTVGAGALPLKKPVFNSYNHHDLEEQDALSTRGILIRCESDPIHSTLHLPTLISTRASGTDLPYTEYLGDHIQFFQRALPWLAVSTQSNQACQAHLKSVNLVFPGVQNRIIVLCMAAWFSVLCTVDDLIEMLEPQAACRILTICLDLLRNEDSTRAAAYTNLPNSSDGPEHKVIHILKALKDYAKSLLSQQAYSSFRSRMCETWQGMMHEADLRTKPRKDIHLEEYMEIRVLTVGIAPFILLLETETLPKDHVKSAALDSLEKTVINIISLQNDLVGFEKDYRNQEIMNFIMVSMYGQEQNSVHQSIEKAIALHNEAVRSVVSFQDHLTTSGVKTEQDIAARLLFLVSAHLEWALKSRRYFDR